MLANLTELQEPYLIEISLYQCLISSRDYYTFSTHSRVEIGIDEGQAYTTTKTSYVV